MMWVMGISSLWSRGRFVAQSLKFSTDKIADAPRNKAFGGGPLPFSFRIIVGGKEKIGRPPVDAEKRLDGLHSSLCAELRNEIKAFIPSLVDIGKPASPKGPGDASQSDSTGGRATIDGHLFQLRPIAPVYGFRGSRPCHKVKTDALQVFCISFQKIGQLQKSSLVHDRTFSARG